ncbi:hypothetical protein SUGI_1494100 [Cryptomeria japonica]|uniref:Uncharacterized protein n=1 Tax=Cryptomeria japonica TaxID=3369 RepID=A0AAD3RPQ4_CRYJA|nr:hypothetical protein SUGI_1224240 [Cryptomeria japonica]GLJ59141.1 hypothetical protein SUGI_1494100 [Cryptomeria japonica]
MSARSKKRVEISVCNAPAHSEMVRRVPGNAKTKTSTAEVVKAKEARKASEFEILFPYVVYADFLVAELEAVVSPTKKVEAIDRVADPEHISRRNRRGHAY